jgi:restriction system protein
MKEAQRDGAPPVDVVDGDQLCDLLREYELGVSLRVAVDKDWFAQV